jgi:hypothetical protein
MAAKLSNKLFRGGGRNALDLPVAGLSALAAAFAAFALPQDLLNRAVAATGLPSILAAAQPPLGLTARVAIAVGSAALVFGIVFLALRLLDRSGLGGAEAEEDSRAGSRVRRRDGHPDAPAPRPISAARDLGEPAPPRAPRAEVPLWLDEAVPTPPAFGATVEFEPVLEPVPEPEADILSEPWQAPEPVVFPEPEPAPEPTSELELTPEAMLSPPEPEPQPAPAPVAVAAPEPIPAPVPEPAPVAVAPPAPAPVPAPAQAPSPVPQAEMPTSIAGLMERLEQGLARRRTIEPAPAPAEPAPTAPPQAYPDVLEVAAAPVAPEPPQVFPEAPEAREPEPVEAANDRLQSAIASLQQLAARSA